MGGGTAMVGQLQRQMEGDPAAQRIVQGLSEGKTIGALRKELGSAAFDQARERVRDAPSLTQRFERRDS